MTVIVNPFVRVAVTLSVVGFGVTVIVGALLHRSIYQLRTHRTLVEQEATITREYGRLLTDLAETKQQRAIVLSLRPDSKDLLRFVEGLETIAAQVFIDQSIAAVPPERDTSGQPYPSPVVRYRLTLHGTLEKIEAYLAALQKLPEAVRVEHLRISTTPDGHVVANGAAELIVAVAVRELPP